MKAIRELFQYLNGKKTTYAALYWGTVMPTLWMWYPEGIPASISRIVIPIGFFLTSIGVGHKWYKAREDV